MNWTSFQCGHRRRSDRTRVSSPDESQALLSMCRLSDRYPKEAAQTIGAVTELRSCVKVEVAVLGFPSLISRMVSVVVF